MADLRRSLARSIATPESRIEVRSAADIEQAATAFGTTRTEQTSRMAMAIAGTTDKSSRAYKSARRSVERYRKAARGEAGQVRKKPIRNLPRIQRVVRRAAVDKYRRGSFVTVSGVIGVPGYERQRTIAFPVSGEAMSRIASAYSRGDEGAMEAAFVSALQREYVPDMEIAELDRLQIEPN